MSQEITIEFSLSTFLNWRVTSNNKNWLNQNIQEFRSSYKESLGGAVYDISIAQVKKISIDKNAVNVSEAIYCLSNSIYIKDKYTDKKMHFQVGKDDYKLELEQGFTFHYYAALLDAFIKIIAFQKDIIELHASAIQKENKVFVFGAWRRMGKTTAILNVLAQDITVQVLADDAVMITAQGQLIPYLRGIDLYPYLPIPKSYLSKKNKLKRRLAKGVNGLPLLPKVLSNKILKRFLLPRLNLAAHGHGISTESTGVDSFYALKKHLNTKTQKNEITASELKNFIGRSSYFEIIEYQAIFEMACSVYPESEFSKLIIDYKTFQDKVNHVISSDCEMLELNIAKDYSDIKDLKSII